MTVYAGSRDAGRGQTAVDEIGDDARLLVPDVADAASIADAARQVGAVVVLLTTGISLDGGLTEEEGVAGFRRVYETNVFGVSR